MTSTTTTRSTPALTCSHPWQAYYAEPFRYVEDDESSVSINDASVVNVNETPVGRNSVRRAVKDLIVRALRRGKRVFVQLRRLKGSSGPVRTPLSPAHITTPHWDANAQLTTTNASPA